MNEKLPRLTRSSLTVVCQECKKEFKGQEADAHTVKTGHGVFHPKTIDPETKKKP